MSDESTPKSDKKSPGFWFYTADYEKDMQILSLSAQGLWSRMLCWMHDNEAHRGFAELPTGEPMTKWDIAARVGKTIREVEKSLVEMERIGTYSKDDRNCIYCRRMARDTHISTVRKAAAKSRMDSSKRAADGSFAGGFAPPNEPAKAEQNPTVTASVSVSDSVLLTQKPRRVVQTIPARTKSPSPPMSQRFAEFWVLHPGKKLREDLAAGVWAHTVSTENEAGVFQCLENYLQSSEVARGAVMNPENWLSEVVAGGCRATWPKARESPISFRKSNAERMLDEAEELMRNV